MEGVSEGLLFLQERKGWHSRLVNARRTVRPPEVDN